MKWPLVTGVLFAVLVAGPAWAQAKKERRRGTAPPQGSIAPQATPIEQMKVAKDFRVELLHSVPKEDQGSWVNLAVDPRGRLIVSDQYGKLYRVTPPGLGVDAAALKLEAIDLPIGQAQGLLCAFDSLYVMVSNEAFEGRGLYRVRDTDGDDRYDEVRLLRKLEGGGEHGPHAILPSPDGKGLYVIVGNQTTLTPIDRSRVPRVWGEDHLLPRMWDGRGFMKGVLAPGGWICRTDPEGREWELIATGFRNEFDAAFDREGELFTFDADMEWDLNTPWYRPTRVCHVVSGAEFGWRSGAGKWPAYYPDSVPAAINVGPGSPTGVTFGYGARFPAKYQEALFICDWSYGKLYAAHLEPHGSSYQGQLEEFISGIPLPLTDVVINPHDGAMYFAIGGRRTQSGLYRVTYAGNQPTAPGTPAAAGAAERRERRRLEEFHRPDPAAVAEVWSSLGSPDRFLRYAARIALEHQEPRTWQAKALAETDRQASLTALLALARVGDKSLQPSLLAALERLDWKDLSDDQRIELLRVYGLTFIRQGAPEKSQAVRLAARLDPHYPAESRELNAELCKMLVYLEAPSAAAKTMSLLRQAPTQEEQMEYATSLRVLRTGWTTELREEYFGWFLKAAGYRGGASFELFVKNIKDDAVASLPDAERQQLRPLIEAVPATVTAAAAPPRPFVKEWKLEELLALTEKGLSNRNFNRGRQLFGAANCFACHRFHNEGGALGPDLTLASGRFSPRDLLESIVEPSKTISDQYAGVTITTTEGKVVVGRIMNLNDHFLMIGTNMLDPNAIERVDRTTIESLEPSKVSLMPQGLLNTLDESEVLDLLAYVLSRGDRQHAMFAGKATRQP